MLQAPTIQAGYIYTKERAVVVAEAAARRGQVERNQYKFRLGWAFCRLEPGDLVRITDEASGISNTVVMIKSIDEDASGFLSVTAVSWFQADYGAAEYDVHEVDRPDFDFNAPPGDTMPTMFQPPADLTANGLELWLAAHGLSENWGGCSVYVSDDNEHYRIVGQITNNARFGPLVGGISADATSMEVDIDGTLLSGTEQDAERGNTLLWVDGECMSYTTATLLQNGHYQLSGLVRGQYNTTPAAHTSGSTVIRCDEALFHAPFNKEDVGKQLYIKFCSFNIFSAAEQSLADVQAYQYTLQPYYIPGVQNLTARNRYRHLRDGVHRYDVVVEWTPPELQSYLEGRVWYKTSGGQVKYLNTAMQNTPVSQMGFRGEWIFGGSGQNTVTIPKAIVGDVYRIAVTTVDIWGVETSPDTSPQIDITVALKTETPNTPDGFGITFDKTSVAYWSEVTNTDIAFYEVRKDPNAGVESDKLLVRVTGLSSTLPLTERTGTLYLFAYSMSGKYSSPAILKYNKPAPIKPNVPAISEKLGGFSITADPIPVDCDGMNIYISGKTLVTAHTVNNTYTHTCGAGVYVVTVAYTDLFGEGERSYENSITVKILVDQALLDAQAVTKEKLSKALQKSVDDTAKNVTDIAALATRMDTAEIAIDTNARTITALAQDVDADETNIAALQLTTRNISSTVFDNQGASRIDQNAAGINAVITNLNKKNPSQTGYTAITALSTGLATKCTLGEATSYFQQDHTGFYIKGSLIKIDGDTVILAAGANAIVNALEAGSITADKISVGSSSGARLVLSNNLLTVYDEQDNLRVRLGVWT